MHDTQRNVPGREMPVPKGEIMNVVVLMGRLTKEPEVSYSQSGTCVCRYSLAVDRKYKRDGEQDADFINCVAFGKGAEFIQKYFHKGMKMVAQGRLQVDAYTTKEGARRYSATVVTDNHEFAEKKEKPEEKEGFMDIDEDVPFN